MHTYQIDALIQWAGTLAVLVFLVAVAYRWARRAADRRHELRLKVLERFSAPELAAILEIEDGRKWLADILTGRPESPDPAGEALRRDIVLICFGLGLGAAGAVAHSKLLGIAGALAILGALSDAAASFVVARRRPRDDGRA
jgi:membrane protein implicated in regulation of membrane protease activity